MNIQTIIFLTLALCLTACYAQRNCDARRWSSCYYFSRYSDTKDGAEKVCQKMKGHLVSIETRAEEKFLRDQLRSRGIVDYWIGLEAIRNRYTEQTGWKWQNGASYLRRYVANWAAGRPDDRDGRENCVIYAMQLGYQWNDVPCFTRQLYICEMRTY